MATFVVVHGAFGNPAELVPVIPLLEALGHPGIAVDLPCTNPAATLDDYARTVVEAMAGIASDHAVFTFQPHELAAVLVAQGRSP